MHNFSILYIEDDKLTQKILVTVLSKHFKKIFVANDGIEGLKLYHQKNPDIILSDITMPNLNGIEMAKVIKRHNPTQKIALFTGYNDFLHLNKALNIGINKYILKPLNTEQMLKDLGEIVIELEKEQELINYNKELEFASQHDELTGLLNRRQFFFLLDKLLQHNDREQKNVAILALDLNKFKPINDTYGHEVGDLVLKRFSETLLKALRKEDIVARFGGDEFAIAIGFLRKNNDILKFLRRIENSLKTPLFYRDDEGITHSISIACSIGITFAEPSRKAWDLDLLMREADKAMYLAKGLGEAYAFFDAKYESRFKIKLEKSKAIKRGVDKGEFMLYYQPIIELRTEAVVAYEALIRWNHPSEGLLTADKFLLYILDDIESITYLGKWVLEEVFKQYERCVEANMLVPLSINISSNELNSKDFLLTLKALLKKYSRVNPSNIIFEFVESIALEDMALTTSMFSQIKALGFKIALDDFGKGTSTLSSFKYFNIDSIKIDKSFVINMFKSKEDYSMVNASIQAAKAFGHMVVAEGVETPEHIIALLELGCDRAQGFMVSQPMEASKILKK